MSQTYLDISPLPKIQYSYLKQNMKYSNTLSQTNMEYSKTQTYLDISYLPKNSQSLEDMQVWFISQKYAFDIYTSERAFQSSNT